MMFCKCEPGPTQRDLEANNWHCPKCELPTECECCDEQPVTRVHVNYMVCDLDGCWEAAVEFYAGGHYHR